MRDLLKQLYEGELHLEEMIEPETQAYKRQLSRLVKMDRALREKLPPELLAEYDAVVSARHAVTGMEVEEACIRGVKIGGQLAAEILELRKLSQNPDECEFKP